MRDARREATKIRIEADENGAAHLADSSDKRIRGIRRDALPQQDDLVTSIAQHSANRIRNAMIDKKRIVGRSAIRQRR